MRKSTINSRILTRKVLSIFLVIAFILTIVQPLSVLTVNASMPTNWTDLEEYYDISWYSEGPTVFNISTPQQLAGLAVLNNGLHGVQAVNFSGKTIQLSNNINLSEHFWTPIGTYDNQFKGTFDGDGFEIQSMNIDIFKGDNIFLGFGFFGEANGYIKNLGIDENSVIRVTDYSNGGSCVGAIVGKTYGSTIQNCYSKAAVSANGQNEADTYVGGIAGEISSNTGKVLNCYNSGSVSATGNYNRIYAGGIAGANAHSGGTIQNCYSYSDALSSASTNPNSKAGGIVGWFCDSIITNSYWKTTAGALNAIGYIQVTENDKTIVGLGSFTDNSGTLTATDATTLSNGTNLLTALNTGTDVGDKSWGINSGVNNDYPVFGDYNKPSISTISTPSAISVGDSLLLSAPTVSDNGFAITEIGWQLSASGTSSWNTYTNGVLNGSFNNYYLRYYATNQYGKAYSNVVNITVNKPSNALLLSCADITYGGTLSPIVTNPSGGELSYSYKEQGADDITYTSMVPSNVGSYTMKATSAETTSFNSATALANFNINMASSTLLISCSNITFGGALVPQVTTNTSGGIVSYEYKVYGTDDSTYTLTSPTNVGNYTLKVTSQATSNYSSATATADFMINQADNSLSISCANIVFGGTPNPQVATNTSGGNVSYEYKVQGADDSTYTTTVPTAIGSYTVRATSASTSNYNSATATANFSIGLASSTLAISCDDIDFGQTPNPQILLNTSGGAVSYKYKVAGADDSTYSPTKPINAGSYIVKATSESTENYNSATAIYDFVIVKANNTLAISCGDITYGGTITPVVITNTSGGSVSYEYKVQGTDDATYTPITPTNTGSYTVRATSASTLNYNSSTGTDDFVINKAISTLSTSCANITFGGTITPTVLTNTSGGIISFAYKVFGADDSTYTSTPPTNFGNYTLKVTSQATANFYEATATTSFSIGLEDNTLVISCANITVGETPSPTVITNTSGGALSYTYKMQGADDRTYTGTAPTNAGSYTVRATSSETANYNSATNTANFVINKADNSLTISCANITFGGTITPTVTTNTSGGTVSYTYKVFGTDDSTYTSAAPTNTGSYTVRATSASTENYNQATATINFVINNANNSLTISCDNITYGETVLPTVTTNTSGGTVSYVYKVQGSLDSTYTPTAPTNAGNYTVMATSDSTANYNSISATYNFTITKATLTATTNNASILAGDTLPTFDVTVTGFVNSENETLTGFVKPTVSHNITDTTIDGDYPLTISGGNATANYQFSYQADAKLTIGVKINAQAPSFNPNLSGEKTYTKNDTATALNGTATVSDSGTVTYKWYKNTTNSTIGGTEISSATDATYTPATNAVGAYYYYVVATNTNASVNGTKTATSTSDFAKVIVNNLEILPVEATAETPKTELKGETAQIETAVLTTSDQEKLAQGSDISIWLDIKKIEAPTADENVMKLMLDGKEIGQYLDLSLIKSIDGEQSKITQTNSPLKITIEIPEALRNSGRTFSIVRVHDGVAAVLVDLDNDPNTITFETNQFSTYAIVYKEVSNVTSSVVVAPVVKASPVAPATNPKTEQNSYVIPIALLAILAISTLTIVSKQRKFKVVKKG